METWHGGTARTLYQMYYMYEIEVMSPSKKTWSRDIYKNGERRGKVKLPLHCFFVFFFVFFLACLLNNQSKTCTGINFMAYN